MHKITVDSHQNRLARIAGTTKQRWKIRNWTLKFAQSWGWHAKLWEAVLELRERQSFGQEISHHFVRGDVSEQNMTPDDTVPHSMVDDVNVLGGRADSTMLEEREWGLVVSEDGDDRDREVKISEHFSEPERFLSGGTRSIVLSLTCGLGYYALELGLPGDGATILAVDPSSGGFPAIQFPSIVRITETLKGCGWGWVGDT
jgi:hypothetical protein